MNYYVFPLELIFPVNNHSTLQEIKISKCSFPVVFLTWFSFARPPAENLLTLSQDSSATGLPDRRSLRRPAHPFKKVKSKDNFAVYEEDDEDADIGRGFDEAEASDDENVSICLMC